MKKYLFIVLLVGVFVFIQVIQGCHSYSQYVTNNRNMVTLCMVTLIFGRLSCLGQFLQEMGI